MEDPSDLRLRFQPLGDFQRAGFMLFEANRHGSKAARTEPRIVGRDTLSKVPAHLLQTLKMLGGCCRASKHDVRMAAYIFGPGKDGDVDPGGNCREEKGRRPGIVEKSDDPPPTRDFCD